MFWVCSSWGTEELLEDLPDPFRPTSPTGPISDHPPSRAMSAAASSAPQQRVAIAKASKCTNQDVAEGKLGLAEETHRTHTEPGSIAQA